jgi:hypothetical protein
MTLFDPKLTCALPLGVFNAWVGPAPILLGRWTQMPTLCLRRWPMRRVAALRTQAIASRECLLLGLRDQPRHILHRGSPHFL